MANLYCNILKDTYSYIVKENIYVNMILKLFSLIYEVKEQEFIEFYSNWVMELPRNSPPSLLEALPAAYLTVWSASPPVTLYASGTKILPVTK